MTEDNSNNKRSAMTTVKTVYARAALMVMCLNVLLTGYAIAELANMQTTPDQVGPSRTTQTEQLSTPEEPSGDKTATSVEGVASDKE